LFPHEVQEPKACVVPERLKEYLHVKLSLPSHALYICFDEFDCKRYICVDVCEVPDGRDS
jgi:hypothetical protein